MLAEPSAITRSGSACLSAPATAWGRKCPMTWRAATGAGWRAFRMLPGGAVMRMGRNAPSLFGTSGLTITLTPYVVYASV